MERTAARVVVVRNSIATHKVTTATATAVRAAIIATKEAISQTPARPIKGIVQPIGGKVQPIGGTIQPIGGLVSSPQAKVPAGRRNRDSAARVMPPVRAIHPVRAAISRAAKAR